MPSLRSGKRERERRYVRPCPSPDREGPPGIEDSFRSYRGGRSKRAVRYRTLSGGKGDVKTWTYIPSRHSVVFFPLVSALYTRWGKEEVGGLLLSTVAAISSLPKPTDGLVHDVLERILPFLFAVSMKKGEGGIMPGIIAF